MNHNYSHRQHGFMVVLWYNFFLSCFSMMMMVMMLMMLMMIICFYQCSVLANTTGLSSQ